MKANDLRNISMEELEKRFLDLKQELFNLRFQVGMGKLTNTMKARQIKRDIGRTLTIIKEKKEQEAVKVE